MKKNNVLYLLIPLIFMVVALACVISFGDEKPDEKVAFQLTLQAIQQTQTAAIDTQEPVPTQKVEEEILETPTITPTPIPCNKPKFQSETIPDGTEMDPGETFVKSWRIKNDGTCAWNTNYKLVFDSGDKMGGPSSKNLTNTIEPGEIANFSVNLTAPSTNGEYKGFWKLQSDKSEQFGNYWVQIRVGPPPAAFAVTKVTFNVHANVDMACPNDVNVKAEITSSAAGTVTYRWEDTAGGSSSLKLVTFDAPGKKIVDYNATINATDDYEARIYIDNPNHQWFGPVGFHVNCTP